MRYAVRDPETGKFAKTERINWKEVKIMTTIDNATSEDVTQQVTETTASETDRDLPAMLRDDETTIRTTFQKFVDGVVSLSSYARQVDMLVKQMETLKATIEEANARVLEAVAARDTAVAEAQEAKRHAKMADEAYRVVDLANEALKGKLEMYASEIEELKQSESILQGRLASEEENHRSTQAMYMLAREERERFRDEASGFRNQWEDEQLKNMEFEETKEKLATTEEALGICAKNVAAARAEALERLNRLNELDYECKGLLAKANALEDDNKRQGDQIQALQTKINNASMHLH